MTKKMFTQLEAQLKYQVNEGDPAARIVLSGKHLVMGDRFARANPKWATVQKWNPPSSRSFSGVPVEEGMETSYFYTTGAGPNFGKPLRVVLWPNGVDHGMVAAEPLPRGPL
jgi:hypothetical protein